MRPREIFWIMTKEEILKRVEEYSKDQEWNHFFIFPFGIETKKCETRSPGFNTNKWIRLEPILDRLNIKNKKILDVGCSDGYFSVQCAKKGAARVLGIDADELRIKRARFAKQVYELENVEFRNIDLYDEKLRSEKFNIVIGLGLLHRIPDIYSFLKIITDIGCVAILEFKAIRSYRAICKWGGGEVKSNKLNKLYFLPSVRFVMEILEEFGFNYHKVFKDRSALKYKRVILVSSRDELWKR